MQKSTKLLPLAFIVLFAPCRPKLSGQALKERKFVPIFIEGLERNRGQHLGHGRAGQTVLRELPAVPLGRM